MCEPRYYQDWILIADFRFLEKNDVRNLVHDMYLTVKKLKYEEKVKNFHNETYWKKLNDEWEKNKDQNLGCSILEFSYSLRRCYKPHYHEEDEEIRRMNIYGVCDEKEKKVLKRHWEELDNITEKWNTACAVLNDVKHKRKQYDDAYENFKYERRCKKSMWEIETKEELNQLRASFIEDDKKDDAFRDKWEELAECAIAADKKVLKYKEKYEMLQKMDQQVRKEYEKKLELKKMCPELKWQFEIWENLPGYVRHAFTDEQFQTCLCIVEHALNEGWEENYKAEPYSNGLIAANKIGWWADRRVRDKLGEQYDYSVTHPDFGTEKQYMLLSTLVEINYFGKS
jgi:hypothetical protein